MSRKRMPSDQEIASLADHFRELWKPGEEIRPWLREQGDELYELVHNKWSWASMALVLTSAGIVYRTGKPWSADLLRKDFSRAQSQLKGYPRRRKEVASVGLKEDISVEPLPSLALPQPLLQAAAIPQNIDVAPVVEEPEFKLVKLANWSGSKSVAKERLPPAKQTTVPAVVHDVDAILAHFIGRKSSS